VKTSVDRREFLQLAGIGGVAFASGLAGCAGMPGPGATEDFYFVQLSDSHWGFEGPPNPDAKVTLRKAVAAVNALTEPPDFIMFTGDLTHITEDARERRKRLSEFRDIVGDLKVRNVRFMPGEHDASLDQGKAFREYFGATHYTFEHKGVHFIVIDNVSDPRAFIGDEQLEWLAADLGKLPRDASIVVFTHRPLFDLYPQWDWATRDGAKAIDLLMPYSNVTVFYGHIHQENHRMTGHIAHHSARSLMFPLPAPASQPKRDPLPWDPSQPYRGLGYRSVEAEVAKHAFAITEMPVQKG
jgi:3',5'-cyclic AMP phosphodiesterase CpdA